MLWSTASATLPSDVKGEISANIITSGILKAINDYFKINLDTGDIQAKLKKLFAGTIEQMLEAEMDEHLGYEKNSVLGNNSGNSRNGYGKKTISSEYG